SHAAGISGTGAAENCWSMARQKTATGDATTDPDGQLELDGRACPGDITGDREGGAGREIAFKLPAGPVSAASPQAMPRGPGTAAGSFYCAVDIGIQRSA